MSRPFFFTGRKQIRRSDAQIRLRRVTGHPLAFDAELRLRRYRLPSHASVVVEAYNQAYLQRFEFGSVSNVHPADNCVLTELAEGDRPLFRVKVVDMSAEVGLLLAAVESIRPREPDDSSQTMTLLPIVWLSNQEMGQQVWRVTFSDEQPDRPQLQLNGDVSGLRQAAQTRNPRFEAYVYPEALRTVLTRQLLDERALEEEYCSLSEEWAKYVAPLNPENHDDPGDPPEIRLESRREWIESVIDAFCKRHRYLDRLNALSAEEGS